MIDAILGVYKRVPTRPTAFIELGYVMATDAIVCVVYEQQHTPRTETTVARIIGPDLELCYPKYDQATQKSVNVWHKWNERPRFQTEVEALCYAVILFSDVGCPNQARSDFPKAIKSTLWSNLLTEMKNLQPVASVMLT